MGEASLQQTNPVLLPKAGAGDRVYWDAQWRYRSDASERWRQKKRRLGRAWLEPDLDDGGWRKRKGRCREGWLDERAAYLAAREAMEAQARDAANEAQRAALIAQRSATVRGLADDWLHWLEDIRGAKPSTIRDYRVILREPGRPHRRGSGKSRGRILKAFGDALVAEVATADVSRFLRALDKEGLSARNVNKHRQVLHAMFGYATRSDTLDLLFNPSRPHRQAARATAGGAGLLRDRGG